MNGRRRRVVGVLIRRGSGRGRCPDCRAEPQAPPPDFDVRAHYTKYEYRIPMRDGKRLFTSSTSPRTRRRPYPSCMTRTPYSVGPTASTLPRPRSARRRRSTGRLHLRPPGRARPLHVRGRLRRDAPAHRPTRTADVDESTDTCDTVEWLLKHVPNHNGRVGIWGISYAASTRRPASSTRIRPSRRPRRRRRSPTVLGDDWLPRRRLHAGAPIGFNTSSGRSVVQQPPCKSRRRPPPKTDPFDYGTTDGYEFFLRTRCRWPTLTRRYFKEPNLYLEQLCSTRPTTTSGRRAICRAHLTNISCAVLTVGGWFDAEDLYGPFKTYQRDRAATTRAPSTRWSMGPWTHGGWARWRRRASAASVRVQDRRVLPRADRLPVLRAASQGQAATRSCPRLRVRDGHQRLAAVRRAGRRRTRSRRTLYFHAGGRLSFDPPAEPQPSLRRVRQRPGQAGAVHRLHRRRHAPSRSTWSTTSVRRPRPDVLVYQTEPLEEDLTSPGRSRRAVRLDDGTDSDCVVKLIDVYPDDYPEPEQARTARRRTCRAGERWAATSSWCAASRCAASSATASRSPSRSSRARSRRSSSPCPTCYHTFRRGHRIMVQVQSSWFPLVDRNPQTFVDIPNAKASDFQKATERVYHDKSAPSGLVVGVLGK